jgi:hypothetical protein
LDGDTLPQADNPIVGSRVLRISRHFELRYLDHESDKPDSDGELGVNCREVNFKKGRVGELTRRSRGEAAARALIYSQQYNKQTRVRHLSNAITPDFWFEETDSRVEKKRKAETNLYITRC